MSTITQAPDMSQLAAAIQDRDAEAVSAWYAHDATLTIVDRDHPPSAPTVLTGITAIRTYYADICGRNIEHEVSDAVISQSGLGYVQHCRYPDGTQVVCATTARLADSKIISQTAVQAWDA